MTVYEGGKDGYPTYRIPAIVRASDQSLLLFAEARQGGDASQIDLVVKRSKDNGRTWGPLQVVVGHERFRTDYTAETTITAGNPAPVVLTHGSHRGRILLPFTVENARVFVTYSDDNGLTWSDHREITENVRREDWGWYALGPVHSIELRHAQYSGRIVVPANHRIGEPGKDDGPYGSHMLISDDAGANWRLGAIDSTYTDPLNANETSVVERPDGSLYSNTRNNRSKMPETRGDAVSCDGGETYAVRPGKLHPFAPSHYMLDPPVVQSSLLGFELSGEEQLLAFAGPDSDGPSGPGRSDMALRHSFDGGETWEDLILISAGPAAYSDMVRISESAIGLAFETGETEPYERIDFVPVELSTRFLAQANYKSSGQYFTCPR
ncbi:exo-alpha-sialidase [Erythrobacter sp. NFXS35]|uniref:sialidase family protein n=1 Tax=Erythrobacter sp. NFXS35 TaxID=2818436 RepID=UPI0032DFEA39